MPTYEYECKGCSHRFERVQRVADPPPTECPECKKGPIQKIFTSVGIIFKGSGFHVNDYRKPGPAAEGDSQPGDKSNSKEEPKTDAAPKPPADAKPGVGEKAAAATAPASPTPAPASSPSSTSSAEKVA